MHSKETDLHLKTCKECIKNDVCFMPQDEVCPKYASKNITHYAYEQGAKDTAKEIEEMTETINDLYGADAMYYGVDSYGIATALYNAGYRKQSEVIDEFVKRLLDAFPECNRDARCPAIYYDDYRYIIEELAEEMKGGE